MNDPKKEADEFKSLVLSRTGIDARELRCPREKSSMTPCLARDGSLALAYSGHIPLCVGCDAGLRTLLAEERGKTDG